jgi:hypothetical protein
MVLQLLAKRHEWILCRDDTGVRVATVLHNQRVVAGGLVVSDGAVIAEVLIQPCLLMGVNNRLVGGILMLLVMDDEESDARLVVDDT